MSNYFLDILRNKDTDKQSFRKATDEIAKILAVKSLSYLASKPIEISTPFEKVEGQAFNSPALIVVLRSGVALLPSFLATYPQASVGFVGIYREHQTKKPILYYENLPKMDLETKIFVLDPMIASGQTLAKTVEMLVDHSAAKSNITLFSILSASRGIDLLKQTFPEVTIETIETDFKLNHKLEIVPGLGDFGDRYFGN